MPTDAERDSHVAALRSAAEWMEALDLDAPPPDPPPPGNKVVDVVVTPGERSLTVTWASPLGTTAVLLAWGNGSGFVSSSGLLPAGTTSYTIPNLRPVPHVVDILLSQRDDLTLDPASKVSVPGEPLPGPVAPGGWPSSGAWDEKQLWVLARAGAPDDGLEVVESQADLARLRLPGNWNTPNRFWDLPAGLGETTFTGLDVRGELYVRGRCPHLQSVKSMGVRFAAHNVANDGKEVRLTEVGLTKHPTFPVGNGSFNSWGSPVLIFDRCDLSGHADGIQHSGRLVCTESYFHDQIYTATTHNDWCQGYGGSSELFERCYFHASPPNPNNQNGLILTDGPSPAGVDVVDSMLVVEGQHRGSSWAINAYMGPYRVLRSLVAGRTVGRQPVTFTESERR